MIDRPSGTAHDREVRRTPVRLDEDVPPPIVEESIISSGSTAAVDPVRVDVRGLTKSFGAVQAVTDLSFTVEPGSVTGFLGPNGAGKTTTLRMLLGLEQPDAGTATFNGAAVHERCPSPSAPSAPSSRPPSTRPGPGATTCASTAAPPGCRSRRADEVLVQVGLADAGNRRAGGYSLGMRQRLALADGPARRPRRPRARRAGQRPGPRGHPVAARLHPAPRARRGPHRAGLQPPAVGGRADRRPRGDRRRRPTGPRGLDRRSCAPAPTAPAPCSSAARRPPGSPTCCAAGRHAGQRPRTAARSPSPADPAEVGQPRLRRRHRAARAARRRPAASRRSTSSSPPGRSSSPLRPSRHHVPEEAAR